jgi:hypothetical protein
MVQSQLGQIVHETLSQKSPSQKKKSWWSGMAQGVGPEFKPQYHKKEKSRVGGMTEGVGPEFKCVSMRADVKNLEGIASEQAKGRSMMADQDGRPRMELPTYLKSREGRVSFHPISNLASASQNPEPPRNPTHSPPEPPSLLPKVHRHEKNDLPRDRFRTAIVLRHFQSTCLARWRLWV